MVNSRLQVWLQLKELAQEAFSELTFELLVLIATLPPLHLLPFFEPVIGGESDQFYSTAARIAGIPTRVLRRRK